MTLTLHPRLRTLVSGLALMAMALAGALVALTPAAADDVGAAPGGDLEEQDLEVSESALYAHPYTDALPPTLTDSVPPQVICVVQPDLCPQELRPVTEALGDGVDTTQDEAQVSPVQPVPEGSIAVAYFGGFERYESAVKFELPDLPDDEEVVAFNVSFAQEEPTYDLNSPAFRDFIQATMVSIGDQDPGVMAERLPGILAESDPVEFDSDAIRMEACPLTQPFEPGGAPEAQHADEMPREDGPDEDTPGEPAVDCMLGGTGTFNEDTERWEFDLAFAADAWTAGDLDNNGLLISPLGVGNLAYGDPDLTTNAQVTVDIEDVTVAYDTAEPPPPVEDLDAMELDEPETADDMALEDGGDGFDDAPANDGAGFDDGAAEAPEVADGAGGGEEMSGEPVDDPEVAGDSELEQAAPAGTEPHVPWWIWLLVPAFAGGAYLVGNAMTATPLAAVAGGERPGAMSRLIASRNGGGPPTPA